MRAQLALTQRTNERWTLQAMLATENALLAAYRKETKGATGVLARALRTLIAHAALRSYVLTRHLEGPIDAALEGERPKTFDAETGDALRLEALGDEEPADLGVENRVEAGIEAGEHQVEK